MNTQEQYKVSRNPAGLLRSVVFSDRVVLRGLASCVGCSRIIAVIADERVILGVVPASNQSDLRAQEEQWPHSVPQKLSILALMRRRL